MIYFIYTENVSNASTMPDIFETVKSSSFLMFIVVSTTQHLKVVKHTYNMTGGSGLGGDQDSSVDKERTSLHRIHWSWNIYCSRYWRFPGQGWQVDQ